MVGDDAASEPEVLNYDWYGCPHCLRTWSVEQLRDEAKVCNLGGGLPAPKLVGRIGNKPVNFIETTEANAVKASTEVTSTDERRYETNALRSAMSGLFDMTTQSRGRRA